MSEVSFQIQQTITVDAHCERIAGLASLDPPVLSEEPHLDE